MQSDQQILKQKIEEHSVSIRKQNRQKILNQKRQDYSQPILSFNIFDTPLHPTNPEQSLELQTIIQQYEQQQPSLQKSSQYIQQLRSADLVEQHIGSLMLRKLLSVDNPPLYIITQYQLIDDLRKILICCQYPWIRVEVGWIIANCCTGDQQMIQQMVDGDGLELIVQQIGDDPNLNDQIIWAMGNLAVDDPGYRDRMVRVGVVPKMISIIDSTYIQLEQLELDFNQSKHDILMQRYHQTIWALSNFLRVKPLTIHEDMFNVVHYFIQILGKDRFSNMDLEKDITWALQSLFQQLDQQQNYQKLETIQSVLVQNISIQKLVMNIGCQLTTLMVASCRIINLLLYRTSQLDNCVDNADRKEQLRSVLMKCGIVHHVYVVLSHASQRLVEKGLYMIYYLVKLSNGEQAMQLVKYRQIIVQMNVIVTKQLSEDNVGWVFKIIDKMIIRINDYKIYQILLEQNMIATIVEFIDNKEFKDNLTKALLKALKIVYRLLQMESDNQSQSFPSFKAYILKYGVVEHIQFQLFHKSNDVVDACNQILEQFFKQDAESY